MKKMIKGNHAIAEAALRAGLQFYAGYPITPQTEVMEYLSGRMPELENRIFVQTESELAAVNMLFGASAVGFRCMTSSSGPGMSLKQEGMSYLCRAEFPCVLLNVTRWGAGLGSLNTGQTDYLRDTRGGGNGGYRTLVLAPNSIQESVDLMMEAFDLADKYRNPVVIMSEANLGQMEEPCEMPDFKELAPIPDWALNGKGGHNAETIGASDPNMVAKPYVDKWNAIKENEQRWESYKTEDAEYVFVAFGLPSRAVKDTVDILRNQGEKVGVIRPIAIWPFPYKAFAELGQQVKAFISVEGTDLGQMVEDVCLASKKHINRPVYLHAHGQVLPTTKQLIKVYEDVKNKRIEEVM